MNQNSHEVQPNQSVNNTQIVPKAVTIGLFIFALLLSCSGFIPIFLSGDSSLYRVMPKVILLHVVVIPTGFILAGLLMNKFKLGDKTVQWQNSVSLGLLLSCVWMLWKMGGNE